MTERKSTTVTVHVSNPLDATNYELLMALRKQTGITLKGDQVEYINWRNKDGRVCFGVSWEVT